jgi:hypothetical protein
MFAQTPTHTAARFTSLRYRATPHTISRSQQARAAQLATSVKAIRPGVYSIGACIVDEWRNSCTCQAARRAKLAGSNAPCIHRLALWLAEGVQLDDRDPAAYLRNAGIEQPGIIAIYARVTGMHGLQRIERYGEKWAAVPLNDLEAWSIIEAEDITHLQPLYE